MKTFLAILITAGSYDREFRSFRADDEKNPMVGGAAMYPTKTIVSNA